MTNSRKYLCLRPAQTDIFEPLSMAERVVRSPGAAMAVLEAAHSGVPNFDLWARGVCDAAGSFYQSDSVGLSILERCDDGYRALHQLGVHERVAPEIATLLETTDPSMGDVYLRAAKVLVFSAASTVAPSQLSGPFRDFVAELGAQDAVSMTGNVGRISFSLFAMQKTRASILPREQSLLTRVCLHLEQSLAFRLQPGREVGVLEPGGRVVHAVESAREPAVRERLTRHVRDVEGVRTRRGRAAANAIDLWTALVRGRWGLIERTDSDGRRHYVILENPESTSRFRALSSLEERVVELSASGLSGKLVVYALGVSASAVSHALASAALKTGCTSRTELVRVAALLLRGRGDAQFGSHLTPAERDVLGLVRAGFSNAEIAARRRSSESTVANQVSSLLKKARVPTRRVLASLRDTADSASSRRA